MRHTNPNGKARLAVLRAIRNDPSATMDEVAMRTGYSKTTVHYHIHKLQDQGIIDYVKKPAGVYDRSAMRKNIPIVKVAKSASKPKTKAPRWWKSGKRPKPSKQYEAECFERAVALGLKHDAEIAVRRDGVFHDNKPLFRNGTLSASKVG